MNSRKIYQISQLYRGILLFCNKIRFVNKKMSNSKQLVKNRNHKRQYLFL